MPIELGALPVDAPKFRWEPWDAGSKPGRTDEATRANDFIYVPGDYNRIEDVGGTEYTRLYISRFSALDPYSLDTTWNPAPNARVISIAHDSTNDLLYMGGQFTSISGATRTRLVAYDLADPTDPALNARFAPSFAGANGGVNAVELDGNGDLWIGGSFGSVGGSTRERLAKLDVSTTTVTVEATPGNLAPVAVFGTQRDVQDLVWDAANNQMLVAFRNSVTITGNTGKLFAIQPNGTINWAVNPLSSSNAAFTFQLAKDDINAYLALNGSNWTYAYRLTDGVLRWTWHTDGNNQGVQTLGGYVYITHHGDWTAAVKDSGTANNTTPKSVGIVAIDQNGILQTSWRPELRYPPGDPYGTGVLKGFDIGKDDLSGQLYISGDMGGVYDAASGDSINARRFALFEGAPVDPPPPVGTFRLTVNIGGAGSGTVVSSPAGINSSTTAVFDFDEDEVVLLTATPDAGSEPVNWSGSGTGSAPRSITMSSDKSVTATFALTVGGGGGYGGPGDGVPILLAGGDFLAGNGRPDGGRAGVAALLQPYFDQDDAIGFVTLGDHAYNDGAIAEFDGFDTDFGAMDRKNSRDFLFPTPGSHDYGSWGTSGSAEVGMTGFDTYFEGLGLTIDNDDTANQFYRVDDIIDADGGTTSWRLLRINGVLARSGFAQTQGGQQDGLIIPMRAGSPQYAFIQETMQAAKDDGKFLVVASAHPRWTSPSPTNHTSEARIKPAWDLADALLPGRCVFISGHQHNYERFEPQTADGTVDTEVGHVQFVAGTAGNPTYSVDTPLANSAALNWDDAGLLELTLRDDGYGYRYVLNDGSVFDEGEVAMSTGGGGSGGSTLQSSFDNASVSDGDNVTTANSATPDGLNDVVKTGTGVTIKYETTNPAQGDKCVQIVVPATTTTTKRGYVEHFLTTASAYPDVMVRPYQAAWSVLMSGHREDGTKRWSVVVRKDGRVELRDRKNTTIATSTQKLPVAAWSRISVKAVLGASQSLNILEMRLYGPDLNTVTEVVTETNMNLGLVNAGLMDLYRVGLLNPSKNNRTLDIDTFRVQDSGYFGEVDIPVEGWVFDASGPPGGGGPNGIVADPNTSGVYHTIWDVGGYRRSTPTSDQFEMRMKGNSHDSQRKTAAIRAIDSGVATRLLQGGGFNPAGYSESLDGGDEWFLMTAITGGFNSQSPAGTPDTTYLPHIPRSTGQLVDYDGSRGLRYWGTFKEGVKRYPGSGSPTVIAMDSAAEWYIRNLWLDPQDSTVLFVATYNDSNARGGVWKITGVNTGSGKTATRMTPTTIGQVNKIIWSEDSNRMYIAAGVDGVWRATRAGGFTDWVDIGGTRISKQREWCGGDVYSNGSNDVLVIVSHRTDPVINVLVDANGDPGATSGNRFPSVYVCDTAQTGTSPTWNYVSDPGSAGFPGGGDQDVNVNSRLTGQRFWKADDNSGNNILGRRAADVVDFAWNKLSTDGATKEGMLVGGGGAAWFTDDNARTWQVTPDGCTIVSCMSVYQDQARPTYSWQTIQDWDAFFIKDITEEHPTWLRTPNVQNYTTAYGGFGAPDGTVLLLEGLPPASTGNDGEVLRWTGSGADPIWNQIGGWDGNAGSDTSVQSLPSRRPLACTKVKLANGTGRWIVYLNNGGVWFLDDGSSVWFQAAGFPTFDSGNFRQHDMWAPNAWWTGSNVNADGIVFLGVRDSANGGLWVSDDYGVTWNKKVTDNGSSLYVAAARGQSSIVYLSGGSGVRRITNPATMSLNQAARIQAITGFGGDPETIAFHNNGDLYVYCGPSAGVYPRIWQCPDPSTTLTTFDNKVDICDPVDGAAADDSGQAALQYVNNMVFQGDILAIACSGGGVVRGRPRV